MSKAGKNDGRVYREKTCPLLLRVFCGNFGHNSISDYYRGSTPVNELQVYTWLDATLRELASLVKQVNVEARRRGTVFDFAIVSPDLRSPAYRMRDIGSVRSGFVSDADKIMLKDCSFRIGDMIDVAIYLPDGPVRTAATGAGFPLQRGHRDFNDPLHGTVGGPDGFPPTNNQFAANSTAAMVTMMTAAAAAQANNFTNIRDSAGDRRPRRRDHDQKRPYSRQESSRHAAQY
nr:unnamed protein product [Spirometra erinaceieuropaei]